MASNDIALGKLVGEVGLYRHLLPLLLEFLDSKLDEKTKNHDLLRLTRFFVEVRKPP